MHSTRKRLLSSLIRNERGQSSVFVALTAVVFIAFLIFLADIGRLVHDKMLAQAVADSAVLAAANIQAIGLNEIADLNGEIWQLNKDFNKDLRLAKHHYFLFNGCFNWFYYKKQLTYIEKLQDDVNDTFPETARAAAEKIVELHNNMYNKRYYTIPESDSNGIKAIEPWEIAEVMGDNVPSTSLTTLVHDGVEKYFWDMAIPCVYKCCDDNDDLAFFNFYRGGIETENMNYCMDIPMSNTLNMPRKMDSDVRTYYRLRLTRAPIRPLINLANYGFDLHVPPLVVYSQAQPHKGKLETNYEYPNDKQDDPENAGPGKAIYEARLAPLWKVYPKDARTTDGAFITLQSEFKH